MPSHAAAKTHDIVRHIFFRFHLARIVDCLPKLLGHYTLSPSEGKLERGMGLESSNGLLGLKYCQFLDMVKR